MAKTTSNPPPKRGAPYGNHNALKHGFYSRYFQKREISSLQVDLSEGIADEIDLVRVLIQRAVAVIPEANDPEYNIRLLEAVRRSTGYLSRLIQFHHDYTGLQTPALEEFEANFLQQFSHESADFGQRGVVDGEDDGVHMAEEG